MSTTSTIGQSSQPLKQNAPWFILLAGWAAMFGPTYWDLAGGIWRDDDNFHGAIILVVIAWLIWDRRLAVASQPAAPRAALGSALFGFGLLLYILGRSQDILIFEVGAQVPVLAGALLILQGGSTLRALWFPILYFAFMVPLPGMLVDAMTGPLKQWVSVIAEHLLYAAGYPIARSGVMLSIGQYQLLVADACSGLNSMFSLSALGLLYMYLVARKSWLHNGIMFTSILPIAFVANIVRVMFLVLITYHFGDAAGQGFLHGTAGIVLILVALLLLLLLDFMLSKAFVVRSYPESRIDQPNRTSPRIAAAAGIFVGLLFAPTAAEVLRPRAVAADHQVKFDLAQSIPRAFGDWTLVPDVLAPVLSERGQETLDRIYSQTLSRTYKDSAGNRVMLALAYGSEQTDELKAHRPEICYPAQGFDLLRKTRGQIVLGATEIPVTRIVATAGSRIEPVTYWLAIGGMAAATDFERKLVQLRFGLTGLIPDGMLVRVSTIDADTAHAFKVQEQFAKDLIASLPPETQSRIGISGL